MVERWNGGGGGRTDQDLILGVFIEAQERTAVVLRLGEVRELGGLPRRIAFPAIRKRQAFDRLCRAEADAARAESRPQTQFSVPNRRNEPHAFLRRRPRMGRRLRDRQTGR